jgi:CheY-like chemotaxis protein
LPSSVLIVDDEFGLADVTGNLLEEVGYDVAVAINGKLGLASLGKQRVDVVLVDLTMPVMDGPEMVHRMRADPDLAAIPAILMTALPEAVPVHAEELFVAVLVKPFSLAVLLEELQRALARRQR